MNKNVVKSLIKEYQKLVNVIDFTVRDIEFDDNSNYILVGVRRAGKSFLLYQNIRRRIECGHISDTGFLYVNFEDERLRGIRCEELGEIIDCYREMYDNEQPEIYLDEVQNIDGWEKFARRLADMKYKVMITGSNAKMLGREMSTTLGGRYIPRYIEPFSFIEFLKYMKIVLTNGWEYDSETRLSVYKAFETYFHNGGFAENFEKLDKREYINSLYQKILMGDIVERHKVRNSRVFRLLGRKLADSVMQPTTITRLKHIVESTGERISMPVVKDYLEYMADACLIFSVPNKASALTDQETIKKQYYVDNGILNIFLTDENSKLLENIVAIKLHAEYRNTDEELRLFYYNRGVEVDFCVPEAKLAIQVSFNPDQSSDTFRREIDALCVFLDAYPDYKGLIISYDFERDITIQGREIKIVPVWKWLVNFSSYF